MSSAAPKAAPAAEMELSEHARLVLDVALKRYPSALSLFAFRQATGLTRGDVSRALGELLDLDLVVNLAGVFRASGRLFEAAS